MKKTILTILTLALLAALTGCSKKSASSDSMVQREYYATENTSSGIYSDVMVYSDMDLSSDKESLSDQKPEAPAAEPVPIERKLIRTGPITVEVESLADTREKINSWVSRWNGYIANSSEGPSSLSCTIRIPSIYFDLAVNEAYGLGKLRSKSIQAQDVTDQYYDLQTRLDTKIILQERYQSYLKQAKDIEELLAVERKLNDVTSEVEAMKGQLKLLNSQVDYSTIVLDARLPPNETEQGFTLPDTKSGFKNFLGTAAGFFNGIMFFLLYLILFGVPIILLAALLWWLCFGKIGLIRKLFKKANSGSSGPNEKK
ncbi:MAG: DUF4349 domain-containing protein [Treponema sp.]|nr:DUF4349 domain-containing protein [Treponema sp.]